MSKYTKGIALILEGSTEKVFYRNYLEWLAVKSGCEFIRVVSKKEADIFYEWKHGETTILIKFNVVGTITQITHSGKWFINNCTKKEKIPWYVFLCYDLDSADADISKFYAGDWKILREQLKKAKAKSIVDLAAKADIEDVMLIDLEGICRFLDIEPVDSDSLKGRKGKAKLKQLYRSCGKSYHEGDRSNSMVSNLNFDIITNLSPIQLYRLKDAIFE